MPLVRNSLLPALSRLTLEGQNVVSEQQALGSSNRQLNVGLLNIMPDAAFEATERQLFRLACNQAPNQLIYPHLYTFPDIKRNKKNTEHVRRYYQSFNSEKPEHLDALFITGTNLRSPNLQDQGFWQPLIRALDWASENVVSSFCSCLATHAAMLYLYKQERELMFTKCWGVYEHKLPVPGHSLVSGLAENPWVPHSRHNKVSAQQFVNSGVQALIQSQEAGVALATTTDGSGLILCQGHPEYDDISLLKEYKREILTFVEGNRPDYPPFPANYFDTGAQELLNDYRQQVLASGTCAQSVPAFPEEKALAGVINNWSVTTNQIFTNWLKVLSDS